MKRLEMFFLLFLLTCGCLLLNMDSAPAGQNQSQSWGGQQGDSGGTAQAPPQMPANSAGSLDGTWQSNTGDALIFQGQQYQFYQNGQPVDQGALLVQGNMIITQSVVSGQIAQYRFQIQGNMMVTQNAYGQNFQWQRIAGGQTDSQQGGGSGSQPQQQMPGMSQPGGSMSASPGPTASLSKELQDVIMRILQMESSYFEMNCGDIGCSYFIYTFLEDGRFLYTHQYDGYAAQMYEDGSTAWSSSYNSKDARRGRWSIKNVSDVGDNFLYIDLSIVWEDGKRDNYSKAMLDLRMPEYGPSLWLGKGLKLESVKHNMM